MCKVNQQEGEVELTLQAADTHVHIVRRGPNDWLLTSTGLGAGGDEVEQEFVLTDAQVAATVALFIGDDALAEDLSLRLYEVAEQVWKDVPQHFRPIP